MGRFHRGLGSRWSSGGASLSLLLVGCVSLLACGDGGVSRRPSGYDGFLQVVDAGGRRDTGVRADQFIPPPDSAPPARDSQPPAVDSTAQNTTVVLVITGMTWGTWPPKVRAAVVALDGIVSCNVTISPPEATIVYQPNKVTVPQMIQAIQNAGFGASVK